MTNEVPTAALHESELDEIARSIKIPPCPELLLSFRREMAKDDPDPKVITGILRRDVALSATLLKSANSSFFALRRKAETVEQALDLLGIRQCGTLLSGLIVRKAITADGPHLARFWDLADKRSMVLVALARQLRISTPDTAHTFGLFCDVGIPLLLTRFPAYGDTLTLANGSITQRFTAIEDTCHQTNHATIGGMLARTWGLSTDVVMAIRLHHDYEIINEKATPEPVRGLVALCLVAEYVIQTYGNQRHHEWDEHGQQVVGVLGMTDADLLDVREDFHNRFTEST